MSSNDELEYFRVVESGYTGDDLMIPERRFQDAAAIGIRDAAAAALSGSKND